MLPIKVRNHFAKADPILAALCPTASAVEIQHSDNYFLSLCREIVTQQLAQGAARAIFSRFEAVFPDGAITPEKVLALPDQTLRDTGASWAKVRYVKNLAECVSTKIITIDTLDTLPNNEVIRELTKVKGIGAWTAEMFLMFSLGREDVFSFGDLGLRHALQKLYGMKKEPTEKQMEKITKKWSPYRTYGALLLWNYLDKV